MNKHFDKFFPLLIISIGVLMRLVPHSPNFTPIAATALFGGTYLSKKYAFIIPVAAMLVSDYFIGFHHTMVYVYGSFILTGVIGIWLREHKSVRNVIGASLLSSVLFFLITNFGVWVNGAYARDISGLWQSYMMGIPFFRNTVAGDLFYTGAFFLSFEAAKSLIYQLKPARVK